MNALIAVLIIALGCVARFAVADVSYRPAGTPPPNGTAPWEHKPNEIPDRYLAIVQDRLGHCYTAEAESRAGMEVYAAEVERLKSAILDLQKENATLKVQVIKGKEQTP